METDEGDVSWCQELEGKKARVAAHRGGASAANQLADGSDELNPIEIEAVKVKCWNIQERK